MDDNNTAKLKTKQTNGILKEEEKLYKVHEEIVIDETISILRLEMSKMQTVQNKRLI